MRVLCLPSIVYKSSKNHFAPSPVIFNKKGAIKTRAAREHPGSPTCGSGTKSREIRNHRRVKMTVGTAAEYADCSHLVAFEKAREVGPPFNQQDASEAALLLRSGAIKSARCNFGVFYALAPRSLFYGSGWRRRRRRWCAHSSEHHYSLPIEWILACYLWIGW